MLRYSSGKRHSSLVFLVVIMLAVRSKAMLRPSIIGRSMRHFSRSANVFKRIATPPSAVRPDFADEAEAKYFEFQKLEKSIYSWWEESGYFKPSPDSTKQPYVIPMPPPNVTGYLHMGHAMFIALQDIMARFHRMRGKSTLWLPGTDHAGIATQLLVERALAKEGISRRDLGREKFLERVWEWKEEKGGYITKQMRRLGASADWSKERFTLEPTMSESVTEAFVRLYERGLVYKGDYLVNWSPNLQTAVSDLEVEYSEELGKLYYFKYMLADGSGNFIPVATTRPETILGDTAVCVHPEDERYKAFVGKKVKVPMTDREIPVIADDYVDKEFGTGALKITPSHDPNDYEIGKRHSLPLLNIMNKDASINANGGKYQGLDRFDCREKLWADMDAQGLVIKVDPHTQRVPRSQRGGEIIEPMVSGQWFVKMDNMAKRSVDAVRNGDIKIIPERFEKVWYGWLENIHDWCVSRQLWWGHRIPAYYVDGSDHEYIVARSMEEAQQKAREKYGREVQLKQDDDVLDTWFSSGLWPFATVGWPHAENDPKSDLARFYPASCLETGYDILFFWVARMVMMGLELTDKAPFHTIYMHGLVRDGQGQKMSKTKGNVIDPLEVVDQYGSDALRYSLVTGSTPGQDVPLSMERIESNRNFANKLWNAGKYLQMSLANIPDDQRASLAAASSKPLTAEEISALPLAERYIVSNCHKLVETVTNSLEAYNFGDAGRQIYEFLWDEYADWYIEVSKTRTKAGGDPLKAQQARLVLTYVWNTCLRLLHPFMPFLTESLWQLSPHVGDSIMTSNWPQMEETGNLAVDPVAETGFRGLQSLVRAVRNARAEYNVEAGKKIAAIIRVTSGAPGSSSAVLADLIEAERTAISLLARVDEPLLKVEVITPEQQGKLAAPAGCVHLVVEEGLEAFLPLSDMIDYEKEKQRLGRQAEKLKKDIAGLESRLNSKGFTDKAPENVIAEVRANMMEKKEQLLSVEKSIADMVKA